MATHQAQLEGFVADVLLPRIEEVMTAATNGMDADRLRNLFNHNIRNAMKFFYDRWTPVYLSLHGQNKTSYASKTLDKLCQDVVNVSPDQLQETLVKVLWYILSISLEDMDNVPVFSDQLTYLELESAIKNATRRIS
ncbi:MAG: hypothetical protein ACFFD8_06965 [Candidatus Thorarchaeota archaeon]